jgi:hypothetical protein
MKNLLFFLFAVMGMFAHSQVAINNDGSLPDNSAILDVSSTSKGFLLPRMTQAQRDAITSPAAGLIMWCSDCSVTGEVQVFNGTTWTNMTGGPAGATFPILSTGAVSSVTEVSAISGGNITFDGGGAITARGVCWSTSTNPTTADSITTDGSGSGAFVSNLTGLVPATTYYARAYATNNRGTAYGEELSFTTITYSIGLSYGGGIVFYIDGTGVHGLIASTTNQSTGIPWQYYYGSYTTTGATATAIGTGFNNTLTIISLIGSGNAAGMCWDYYGPGTYDFWFLPSKDELNLMYEQKDVIGGFGNFDFWSSSESANDKAWSQSFLNGTNYSDAKNIQWHVRAIRVF